MKKFVNVETVKKIALNVLITTGIYGISWIITCGMVKLITMCFDLEFTLSLGTGVWLILCLLRWTLHDNNKR